MFISAISTLHMDNQLAKRCVNQCDLTGKPDSDPAHKTNPDLNMKWIFSSVFCVCPDTVAGVRAWCLPTRGSGLWELLLRS